MPVPIVVTLLGITNVVNPVQERNVSVPILVTPLPIVSEVNPAQLPNAYDPIDRTVFGIL
jgi:hypothetical protein